MGTTVTSDRISRLIRSIRGQRVILDTDLAAIYGVKTGHLNRAINRNPDRFPGDFLFRLTASEAMRCQFGIASRRNIR